MLSLGESEDFMSLNLYKKKYKAKGYFKNLKIKNIKILKKDHKDNICITKNIIKYKTHYLYQ